MSTSTRLIFLLILLVGVVMAAAGYFILGQREVVLEQATHNELRAHALTLQIALEDHYRAGRTKEAQQLIDSLSENPKVYGVLLFDAEGQVDMVSDPLIADDIRYPAEVSRVLATDETVEIERRIKDQDVFSIIMPIRVGSERRRAFEIAQPRSFIEADFARARRDIALTTLLLFAAISLGVLVVMRRSLARPIRELLGGAAALGEGDLNYRVIVPEGGSEFAHLAREFNRMADRLAEQRRAAAQAAEERLELEQQLLIAERLAALGRLAAGVAHEMGAPLNVIKGRIEQLLERSDAPREKVERNLTIINHQADVIARTVRQLLELGHPFNLKAEPFTLSALIASTVELIEADAVKTGIEVEFVSGDEVRVSGDQDLLRQVLMNVCLNGMQAMLGGGRLRIEVLRPEEVREGRRFVPVRISDTGPGIAPEHLQQIFDPFFTTKDIGQGTGLGLTVSRRIVEEHGGWIEVANAEEGGAAFTVYLPKAEAEAEKGAGRSWLESGGQHERADTGR